MNQKIDQEKFRKIQQRDKMMEIMRERLRDMKDNVRKCNICLSQSSKRKGREDGKDTMFEELMAENFVEPIDTHPYAHLQ